MLLRLAPGGGNIEGRPGGGNIVGGGRGPLEGGSCMGVLPSSCFIMGLISGGGARPGGCNCGSGRKAGWDSEGGKRTFPNPAGSMRRGAFTREPIEGIQDMVCWGTIVVAA